MTRARLGVVGNPTAGGGRGARAGQQVVAGLRQRGHDVVDLTSTDRATAVRRTRQAVVDGLDALVVVGGDGMVNLGAGVVAETDLPLGIVAVGSGNDAARTLDLPRHDVPAALDRLERRLATGGRAIDAVRAGAPGHAAHEWYVCVLSAGFDAAVNAHANTLTWPRGNAKYVRALGDRLRAFVPYGYRITLDDGAWESAGTLVAVANTPSFGGGLRIAPDARVDDGMLDVVVAGPLTKPGVMQLFPRLYRGTHVLHPAVRVLRTRSVLLEPTTAGAAPPLCFADGEPLGPLPVHVEVRPGALRVLA